jgi:hypothetical protein
MQPATFAGADCHGAGNERGKAGDDMNSQNDLGYVAISTGPVAAPQVRLRFAGCYRAAAEGRSVTDASVARIAGP